MADWDAFTIAMYRALVDLGDDIHKLPSLFANWRHDAISREYAI